MKSYVFWDITPHSPLKGIRRFGEKGRLPSGSSSKGSKYISIRCLLHAGFLLGVLFDLKMEATRSSETSADLQGSTRRYIPEHRTLNSCANICPLVYPSILIWVIRKYA
jgi:hypothetical protein